MDLDMIDKSTWLNEHLLGDKDIDEQHQRLFELVNALPEELDPVLIQHAILALYDYAQTHFASEEEEMKRVDYPFIDDHRSLHDGLIEHLAKARASKFPSAEDFSKFKSFLYEWVAYHILNQDRKFVEFLGKVGKDI